MSDTIIIDALKQSIIDNILNEKIISYISGVDDHNQPIYSQFNLGGSSGLASKVSEKLLANDSSFIDSIAELLANNKEKFIFAMSEAIIDNPSNGHYFMAKLATSFSCDDLDKLVNSVVNSDEMKSLVSAMVSRILGRGIENYMDRILREEIKDYTHKYLDSVLKEKIKLTFE